MRALKVALLVATCSSLPGCGAKPVPQDKGAFVGEWKTLSGFTLQIRADGRARLFQPADRRTRESDTLAIKVAPPVTAELSVAFKPHELVIWKEFLYGKRYRIDRAPYHDGDTTRMLLNGVTFTKQ